MAKKKMKKKKEENVVKIKKEYLYVLIVGVIFFVGGFLVSPLLLNKSHESGLRSSQGMYAKAINSNPSGEQGGQKKEEVKKLEIIPESASLKDIYRMFICACCGKTLDQCSCGMAKEKKSYISALVDSGVSKSDVVLKTAKKFGLENLADKSMKGKIRNYLIQSAPEDRPIIYIEPESYDFGIVSQAKGVVTTLITVKNVGKSDLIIDNMDASCMCTSAALIVNGKEGPKFSMSMHGNPKGWSATLAPGEEAKLKIYYDPNVHKDLRGPVTRTVSIFSNDPVDFEKKVKIELNQVS